MHHYLKGKLTEERISKLSKRKRKRHYVAEFQELGFSFFIENNNQENNNEILDLLVDYCEKHGLALTAFSGPKEVTGFVQKEKNYQSIDVYEIIEFITYFYDMYRIKIITSPIFDLNYDDHMFNYIHIFKKIRENYFKEISKSNLTKEQIKEIEIKTLSHLHKD